LGPLKNADIREAALKCLSFPAFEGIPEFDAKCKKLQKIIDACADSETGDSEKELEK